MKSDKRIGYEQFTPLNVPYWVFYPIIGILILGSTNAVLSYYFGNVFLKTTRSVVILAAPFLPVMYIWLQKKLLTVLDGLSGLLWSNKKDFELWKTEKTKQIFTFNSLSAKVAILILLPATISTIFFSDLNYSSNLHRFLFTIWGLPTLFLCSHGTYICAEALRALYQVVRRPVHIPFFMLPHPSVSNLFSLFSKFATLVTFFYILLIVAILDMFRTDIIGIIWLSIIGFIPLLLFIWSFTQIHILIKAAKINQYEAISLEIDSIVTGLLKSKDTKNMQLLENLINYQKMIKGLPEWPVSIEGTLSFLFTFLTGAVQLGLSILSLKK